MYIYTSKVGAVSQNVSRCFSSWDRVIGVSAVHVRLARLKGLPKSVHTHREREREEERKRESE